MEPNTIKEYKITIKEITIFLASLSRTNPEVRFERLIFNG